MTDQADSPAVYIDANTFIYLIEGEEEIASEVRPFFELLTQRAGAATTSELTLAEVLAKAGPALRRSYLNLIVWSKKFLLFPVTRDVLIETAEYRQIAKKTTPNGKMIKLPDAIHVVTAVRSQCRFFLSADERLSVPNQMTILRPNETGLARLKQEFA